MIMCDVSIIIPVLNGEKWIDNCMKSIDSQNITSQLKLEIVVFNDGSTDKSEEILKKWALHFETRAINFVLIGSKITKGVGAAKNGAVHKSSGMFLCFQDIDDIMLPHRIMLQWQYASNCHHNTLIGSRISRMPIDSTPRYVRWANNLNPTELKLQIYTSNGSTLLMPTWFCHRSVYEAVGGFDETGAGTPEDLIFFHKHLALGGDLHRIDDELVVYTYHENAASFSVTRERIWQIQLETLEKNILPHWEKFTVWNAGKAGKRLVRGLNSENLKKVVAFCDVDIKKIGRFVELYCHHRRIVLKKIPIIHFLDAISPLVICVKLDLTNGQFEKNLNSLNLTEGKDYVLFS